MAEDKPINRMTENKFRSASPKSEYMGGGFGPSNKIEQNQSRPLPGQTAEDRFNLRLAKSSGRPAIMGKGKNGGTHRINA